MRQFAKLITQTGRLSTQQTRNGSYVSSIKTATLNEMPVPSGSWAQHHAAKQQSYNLHLAVGVAVTIATVLAGIQTEAFYLNWGPEFKNKK